MKILTCDDHAIFRQGLKAVLTDLDAEIVEAAGSDQALALLDRDASVDLVLLDLHMPGDDGWVVLRRLRSRHPEVPVVIVSASQDPGDAQRALDQGASGYVLKSAGTGVFRSALQLVLDGSLYIPPMLLDKAGVAGGAPARDSDSPPARGRPVLTARQQEILQLMSRGLTNAEISEMLGISENTVKTHISAILSALDVSNRTEAVLVMRDMGLDVLRVRLDRKPATPTTRSAPLLLSPDRHGSRPNGHFPCMAAVLLLVSLLALAVPAAATTLVLDAADFPFGADVSMPAPGVALHTGLSGVPLTGEPVGRGETGGLPVFGRKIGRNNIRPWSESVTILPLGGQIVFNWWLGIEVAAPIASVVVHSRAVDIGFSGLHRLEAFDAGMDSIAIDEVAMGPGDAGARLVLSGIAGASSFRFGIDRLGGGAGQYSAWVERIEIHMLPEPTAGLLLTLLAAARTLRAGSRRRNA